MLRTIKLHSNLLAVVLTLLTTLSLAPAVEAYTVRGMGECSTWVAGEDDRFWLLGFISGFNYARSSKVSSGINIEVIFRFVTRYCKERPGDDLADAIISFIRSN